MLDGSYQESSSHNTSQFHSNRDTGEKREEVEALFEEAGPRGGALLRAKGEHF